MGRASGNKMRTVATTRFDAAFGEGRGLRGRDRTRRQAEDEQQRREQALAQYIADVSERGGGDGEIVRLLVQAYRGPGMPAVSEGPYADLVIRLLALAYLQDSDEFAAIAAVGDPPGWEGLTAPAVSALGVLFGEANDAEALRTLEKCRRAIMLCFAGSESTESHLRYLQPLIDGTARLLGQLDGENSGTDEASQNLLHAAAVALRTVERQPLPLRSVAGELRPWIDVFAKRLDSGISGERERDQLLRNRTDDEEGWMGVGFTEAYAPVCAALDRGHYVDQGKYKPSSWAG